MEPQTPREGEYRLLPSNPPPGTPQVRVGQHVAVFVPTQHEVAKDLSSMLRLISSRPPDEQRVLLNWVTSQVATVQQIVGDEPCTVAPAQKRRARTPRSPQKRPLEHITDPDEEGPKASKQSDDEFIPPARPTRAKRQKTGLRAAVEDGQEADMTAPRSWKIKHAVSNSISLGDMKDLRLQFHTEVLRLPSFQAVEAAAATDARHKAMYIADYIFVSMLGGARDRIIATINEHTRVRNPGELSMDIAHRATTTAADVSISMPVREPFIHLGRILELDGSRDSTYTGVLRHISYLKFIRAYGNLVHLATQDSPSVIDHIGRTTQGRSYSSIAQDYFVQKLGIDTVHGRKSFSNYLNYARAIDTIAVAFSPGILAVLPSDAYYKLSSSQVGIRRLREIIPILERLLPWLEPICRELYTRVIDPIQTGNHIDMNASGTTVEALLQSPGETGVGGDGLADTGEERGQTKAGT